MQKKTVLIIDNDLAAAQMLKEALQVRYQIVTARYGGDSVSQALISKPDLIILDLDAAGGRGIEACKELKRKPETRKIPLILMIPREQKETLLIGLKAGADDYITKPIYPPEILTRADAHLRPKDYYADLERQDLLLLLELSETIASSRNPITILQHIVEKMSDVIDVSRCSIVSVSGEDSLLVKASSDLPNGCEIKLQLDKYPEIDKALKTRQAVVVNDISSDLLMDSVRDDLKGLDFNSIIVIPILKKECVIGTFFLRTASPIPNAITERIYKLANIIAHISANALENAMLFESMKTAQQFFEQMSIRDGLTKLYNHMHFYSRLKEEFSRAQRHATSLSCVFFDVDDFKAVNDNHGHIVGDEVLREIGQTILDVSRETDIGARYGGDEFALILPNTTADGAFDLANRLSLAVTNNHYSGLKGLNLTVSMGVATMCGDNIASSEQLLQLADDAMYMAKGKGKGRVFQHSSAD